MVPAWAGVNSASVRERATAWASSMRPPLSPKMPTPKGAGDCDGRDVAG